MPKLLPNLKLSHLWKLEFNGLNPPLLAQLYRRSTLIYHLFLFLQSRYASRVCVVMFGWLHTSDISIVNPGSH